MKRRNSTRSIVPLPLASKTLAKRRQCSYVIAHGSDWLIETTTGASSSGESTPLPSVSSASNSAIALSTNASLTRYSCHAAGSCGSACSTHALSSRTIAIIASTRESSAASASACAAPSASACCTYVITMTNCMNRKNSMRSIVPLPSASKTPANLRHCAAETSHGCERGWRRRRARRARHAVAVGGRRVKLGHRRSTTSSEKRYSCRSTGSDGGSSRPTGRPSARSRSRRRAHAQRAVAGGPTGAPSACARPPPRRLRVERERAQPAAHVGERPRPTRTRWRPCTNCAFRRPRARASPPRSRRARRVRGDDRDSCCSGSGAPAIACAHLPTSRARSRARRPSSPPGGAGP